MSNQKVSLERYRTVYREIIVSPLCKVDYCRRLSINEDSKVEHICFIVRRIYLETLFFCHVFL